MFNLYDYDDICKFKTRLAQARRDAKITQEKFAEKLHKGDRSRIANWESLSNNHLIHLSDIPLICQILDVDPNFLLGVSDDKCTNDTLMADSLHISIDSIKTIQKEPFIGKLINHVLSADELYNLLHQIRQVCVNGYHTLTLEHIFSKNALKKLNHSFHLFFEETFYLDMTPELFSNRLASEFYWNQKKQNFFEFLDTIIIDPRYRDMLTNNPQFMKLDDNGKYNALMYDIAKASYKHLLSNATAELSAQKISNTISDIIYKFILTDIADFKKEMNTKAD